MSDNKFSDRLKVAVKAAKKAGGIISSATAGPDDIKIKKDSDYVTNTDIECQNVIKSIISDHYPSENFLAEEDGNTFSQKDDLWIIDPLDGTTNFIHSLGHSAVSIAYYENGRVITGVVYDPFKDELFYAEKGSGAYLNGKPLRVTSDIELSRSVIATGFPFRYPEKTASYFKAASEILNRTSGIRRMGSAALDLVYTAAGRFDAFFEGWLSPWDIAAGILIVSEAGGVISDFSGEDNYFDHGCIIVSSQDIYKDLLKIIQKHLGNEQYV